MGSVAVTSNNNFDINRVKAKAASIPIAMPQKSQFHSIADHQAKNAAGLRAQRHSQTDFSGALCHGISHHAVYADCGERQCDRAENPQEQRIDARLGERFRHQLIHSLDQRNRQISINRPDFIAHSC